jgi:hypothetical protein
MADYIPDADNQFKAWADNFIDHANAHLAGLGLAAGDLAELVNMHSDFNSKLAEHVTAKQAAHAARQAKDTSRNEFKAEIRKLVKLLQASSDIDNSERQSLGITVADTIRTANTADIKTRPVGRVDTSQRLQHKIRFNDESTPTKRAKPAGIMGCEIWVQVLSAGDAPSADIDDYNFVALDTSSPHVVSYDGADGGKTAHYMLRWTKRGDVKGPWSETVSATITA